MVNSNATHRMRLSTLAIALGACLSLAGCHGQVNAAGPTESTDKAGGAESAPFRIAVVVDKTASAPIMRVPQPTAQDFEPILELCRELGCDIAVGAVRDVIREPLVRLHVESPPLLPLEPTPDPNPFRRRDERVQYVREKQHYQEGHKQWQESAEPRIERFRAELTRLLQQRPDAPRTELWKELELAEIFLAEPDRENQLGHRFLMICSDLGHNTSSKAIAIRSGATPLVVTGMSDAGVLKWLNPAARFQSLEAAWRWIITKETTTKRS